MNAADRYELLAGIVDKLEVADLKEWEKLVPDYGLEWAAERVYERELKGGFPYNPITDRDSYEFWTERVVAKMKFLRGEVVRAVALVETYEKGKVLT